jgi:hypothetical protein
VDGGRQQEAMLARRFGIVVAFALSASLSGTATAAEAPDDLQTQPWRGLARVRPDGAPPSSVTTAPSAAGTSTIYLNFDGAQLSNGPENSAANTTPMSEVHGSFPAYGGGAMREAVLQATRADWADFDVALTDQRPGGVYVMCMVGPTYPFQNALGIAYLDCGNTWGNNEITFAFHGPGDGYTAAEQAATISQEVAHAIGLEHVDDPGDIMNPFNAGGDPSFKDTCIPLSGGIEIYCQAEHAGWCPPNSQNSHAELLGRLGSAAPDTAAPGVSIISPGDGASFDAGLPFSVEVSATDDKAIRDVTLYSEGDAQGTDASSPFGWSVEGLAAGDYELYVVATDLAGNEAMSEVVTVHVGGGSGVGGADGGDDDDDSSATDGDDDIDSAGGPGSSWPAGALPYERRDDSGCACATGPSEVPRVLVWLLLILGVTHRRLRHPTRAR